MRQQVKFIHLEYVKKVNHCFTLYVNNRLESSMWIHVSVSKQFLLVSTGIRVGIPHLQNVGQAVRFISRNS